MPALGSTADAEFSTVIDDPSQAEFTPQKFLTIGDQAFSEDIETWKVEIGQNGAMILDATITGRVDKNLVNAPVAMTSYINNRPLRVFDGQDSSLEFKSGSTTLTSSTPLARMDDVPIGINLPFVGNASQLVRILVALSFMYSPGMVRVDPLGLLLKHDDEKGYEADEDTASIFSKVQEETYAVFRDVPGRGFQAFLPLTQMAHPMWSYEADQAVGEDGWTIESNDTLFSWVVVERKKEESSSSDTSGATTTKVVPGYVVRAPVPYRGLKYRPHPKYVDWIVVSQDDVGGKAPGQAYLLARRTALMHSLELFKFSLTVPYNPFLLYSGVIKVGENETDTTGQRWRNEYLCFMNSRIDHEETSTTSIEGTATLTSRTKIPEPPVLMRGPSDDVIESPGPFIGIDTDGDLWLDTTRAISSNGVPWAGIDEDGDLWIDPDFAEGVANLDEDNDLWLDGPTI